MTQFSMNSTSLLEKRLVYFIQYRKRFYVVMNFLFSFETLAKRAFLFWCFLSPGPLSAEFPNKTGIFDTLAIRICYISRHNLSNSGL